MADDSARGLYQKFRVQRYDGQSSYGTKHYACEYFVLDLTHDVHAPKAIRGYIDSCAAAYPVLAADLEPFAAPVDARVAAALALVPLIVTLRAMHTALEAIDDQDAALPLALQAIAVERELDAALLAFTSAPK